MTTVQPTPNSSSEKEIKPEVNPTQEMRFAVVMYGGVSLAIYINGITQELLELVRATAPSESLGLSSTAKVATKDLTGSGKVYRKIGQLLGKTLAEQKNLILSAIPLDTPISTRFIIDILSGTSAGGINAIFLAKALANDESIDKLKDLWIKEGDIGKLLNDADSVKDLRGVSLNPKTESLLNSQRMYLKLLEALEGMETSNPSDLQDKYSSPYVDELDLYVTATYIRGQVIPIQLKDMTVTEKRYRQVFHFVFNKAKIDGDKGNRNDFLRQNMPFLAFVARCTSAFPLAFEPMTLKEAIELSSLQGCYKDQKQKEDNLKNWKEQFFATYTPLDGKVKTIEPEEQAFGDGGYLDNKPFSYATESLLRRHSDLPIKRHLIYIDPSPEHPEDEDSSKSPQKPNAIENSVAALLTLPRSETIREDIERIINRNKVIKRIRRISKDSEIEKDIEAFNPTNNKDRLKIEHGNEWKKKNLKELIQERGISYGSYHRLKILGVTDDLAQLLTCAAGFDWNEEAAEFLAIRIFLSQWRNQNYVESLDPSSEPSNQRTQTEFLINFDFDYRLRRLYFIRRKINELYSLNDSAWGILCTNNKRQKKQGNLEPNFPEDHEKFIEDYRDAFRRELQSIKGVLSDVIKKLLYIKKQLATIVKLERIEKQSTQKTNSNDSDFQRLNEQLESFLQSVNRIEIKPDYLRGILQKYIEAEQQGNLESFLTGKDKDVQKLLQDKSDVLENLANTLAGIYKTYFDEATQKCQSIMNPAEPSLPDAARWARQCIQQYYNYYEDYDMVIFPILYGTDVGETDEVAIIRISSEDATRLMDERGEQRKKLAGTAFFAFGGFFDQKWRENDILWGRLDGSERLISALLPGESYDKIRQELIDEAHRAILTEELKSDDVQKMLNQMTERLTTVQPKENQEVDPQKALQALQSYIDEHSLYNNFKNHYQVNRTLAPEPLLRQLSRSSQIFGGLLDSLSIKQTKAIAPWLTRFGRISWRLVEVASPRTLPNLLFRYWLSLAYLIEAFLIIVGFFLAIKPVLNIGLLTLGITVVINLAIWLLSDFMQDRKDVLKIILFVLLSLWAICGILGVHYLSKYGLNEVFQSLNLWFQENFNVVK